MAVNLAPLHQSLQEKLSSAAAASSAMCQIGSVRQIVAMLRKRNAYFGTTFFSRKLPLACKSANTAARCIATLSICPATQESRAFG
jgi:hypothetical protein